MHVELQPARFSTDLTPEGLRLVVPARRSWGAIVFLCVWLGGWAFGELTVLQELMAPPENGDRPDLFLMVWLAGWTLGGVCVLGTILWQLAGREVITLDATTLTHRVTLLGLGRTRAYKVTEVKNLRATERSATERVADQASWFPPLAGAGHGPVAFDYGARTYRLAGALDEAEAKLLVETLHKRLPRRLA